eukprot:GILI01008142.1.p1 GENE.GILI01008142.1~~GILI01008142.1.p1  ORF type:complete len:306 (-),score=119.24 GILI01008142.1:97-1014(-)
MSIPSATLHNGFKIPLVGLGTWQAKKGEVGAAVRAALSCGYRHIDCAAVYDNEQEVGEAFQEVFSSEQGPKREEVFVTSKLWNTKHAAADVRSACEKTLSDLKLSYLDLYLIHWPLAFLPDSSKDQDGAMTLAPISLRETWQAMEKLVDDGLVRSIGVSNFNVQMLIELFTFARIKPAANQVELHPYLPQAGLVGFCQKHGVHVTAYSPLANSALNPNNPVLINEPVLATLAAKHNTTPANIAIRWSVERGVSAIPKSVSPARIAQNLAVGHFSLSEEDMAQVQTLSRGLRIVNPANFWGIPLFE